MARTIMAIFVDPPIAVARLGGSNVPQDAYRWVEANNPRSDSNTVVDPWWTLEVLGDGSVEPYMPKEVRLRDGELIRPVAPFFEIWALTGEPGSPRSRWHEERLTPALLKKYRTDESALTIQVDAKNRKAARRIANPDLVYGTFPPVSVRGDDHDVHTLFATSPPGVVIPMIPLGRNIPLGSIQIIRSRPQPQNSGADWEDAVNVEVIRFRFNPGRGRIYGPPEAARKAEGDHGIAVEEVNAFLDPDAGWFGYTPLENIEPADTYDAVRDVEDIIPSLGVIDDTCEARITVSLALPGRGRTPLVAHANIFAGPPDFAPDRRPFLSLADELQDRGKNTDARSAALSPSERERWVQDLFERIFETLSQINIDNLQLDGAMPLTGRNRLRHKPISGDHLVNPTKSAMTRWDKLRNDKTLNTVEFATRAVPLPLFEAARTRHRAIQDMEALKLLIAQQPKRLETLIRRPFEVEKGESDLVSSMRMPPFMRNSNAYPLTLSFWQYKLLMQWVDWVKSHVDVKTQEGVVNTKISEHARERRERVLARLPPVKPRGRAKRRSQPQRSSRAKGR
jgi:hypothetical protein